MTTVSFDTGYALFHSDSAPLGYPLARPAILRSLGRLAASRRLRPAAAHAGHVALALVPFSTLAWIFVAH